MAGLSSRALRIYDEAGLLPPAAVDDATGYRVDRHWRTLATRLGAVRQVIEALHRLVDGDDPGEVDTVDVQAIVIYVLDMARSRWFYQERLGLPLVYEHHGRYGYQVGASRLLLHPRESSEPCAPSGELGLGLELSLGVDSVDALVDRLARDGVLVTQAPADQPWGERDAVVRDPDGLHVRLSQSLPDSWLLPR